MEDFLKDLFLKVYRRKHAHLEETDYCKYDNQILTLFTSSLYFAAFVSIFEHAMLIIGRCLLGVGIGFGNQAVPLYFSEMAPAKVQGAVNQLFQLTTCLRILIAKFINYAADKIHPWGWRLHLGKLQEAREVLEKVRGTTKVDAEFSDLKDASDAARAVKEPFSNLLRRKNHPQLVIAALGIPAFQQLTGMNSILFYAPVIFQSLGFGSGASLYSSAITSAALVIATFISMAFVDKFRRRAFFLEAGVEMICVFVADAVTLALKFGEGEKLPKGIGIFLVFIICIFVLAYGRSWGPLGWLVPSELFPLETRSAGQSMEVCVNTPLIAQCFLVSLCHLKYGIFLLFAGLIFSMSCSIFFLLPETKQVPIEGIDLLRKNHWFWRFTSYQMAEIFKESQSE
ncbi:unnamed protein product [Withania somnifera]